LYRKKYCFLSTCLVKRKRKPIENSLFLNFYNSALLINLLIHYHFVIVIIFYQYQSVRWYPTSLLIQVISGKAEIPITEMRMKTDLLFPMCCLENVCVREYVSIALFHLSPCVEGRVLYRHHLASYDRWVVSAVVSGTTIIIFNVVHVS
jgi:hypothetical protein